MQRRGPSAELKAGRCLTDAHIEGGCVMRSDFQTAQTRLTFFVLGILIILSGGAGELSAQDHITVEGDVRWANPGLTGPGHPVRGATVVILSEEETLEAADTTDDKGHYKVEFTEPTSGEWTVQVLSIGARGGELKVTAPNSTDCFDLDNVYCVEKNSSSIDDTGSVDFFIKQNRESGAFSILDALITARRYMDKSPSEVGTPNVIYPSEEYPVTGFDPETNTIHVQKRDQFDWDIIHEEYGHFVQNETGIADLEGISNPRHSFDDFLSLERGNEKLSSPRKDTGTQLAWVEGWARFFALFLQQEQDVSALGIPHAGDLKFEDTDNVSVEQFFHIESQQEHANRGEDNEVAIARVLWDLHDDNNDNGDLISLDNQETWNTLTDSEPSRLSDAYQALTESMDMNTKVQVGGILSGHHVSPTIDQYGPTRNRRLGTHFGIQWHRSGGGFLHNEFTVEFWTENFDTRLGSRSLSLPEGGKHKVDAFSDLNLIANCRISLDFARYLANNSSDGGVKITLKGEQTTGDPDTGPYISLVGPFEGTGESGDQDIAEDAACLNSGNEGAFGPIAAVSDGQALVSTSGTLSPEETQAITAPIDESVSKAIFSVQWAGSDIDVVLETPSGQVVNRDTAASDPNVSFFSGGTFESYIVTAPVAGGWEMRVEGVDIPDEGEPFTAFVGRVPIAAESAMISSDGLVDFGDTGIDINFSGTSGSGIVTVRQFGNPPTGTNGIEEDNVSSYRHVIEADEDLSFTSDTEVRFDADSLGGISDPGDVTTYKRPEVGQGSFSALETTFDTDAGEMVAKTGSFSEFALASDSNPLPVEISGLSATVEGEKIRLTWQTLSEQTNAGFNVQHQPQSSSAWNTLGFVESKAPGGTTTKGHSYEYVAENLSVGTHQLRLKQEDLDGSTTVTDPVTVRLQMQEAPKLTAPSPNPVSKTAHLSFAVKEEAKATVAIYNTLGQRVKTLYDGVPTARENQRLRLNATGLPSGTYFIRLQAGDKTRTRRLTVVR